MAVSYPPNLHAGRAAAAHHVTLPARGGQRQLGGAGVLMDGRLTKLQLQARTRSCWPPKENLRLAVSWIELGASV